MFVLWCGEIPKVQLLIEFSIAQLALGQAWHIESVPPERLSILNPDPSLTVDTSLECLCPNTGTDKVCIQEAPGGWGWGNEF